MKTVVSKTGIQVLYPCTVHLLKNGEILECEYKSDHVGQDLLDYVCQYQNLTEKDYWGLRFVDVFEQRHWLELDQLIRPQVKNVCPIHFHFRVKIYQPEPYRMEDAETRYQIFMQLRYDLLNGKLCCGPNDSSLLLALILQYLHGDFDSEVHFGNYVKHKALLNQTFVIETKAMEIHKNHLSGLTKAQVEDLFLRMACQLETYGVDPYNVEDSKKINTNLWINYKGLTAYTDDKKEHYKWMDINNVIGEGNKLSITMADNDVVEFLCGDEAECKYIYRGVKDHLTFFTSCGRKSTITLIGTEQVVKKEKGADDAIGDGGSDEGKLKVESDDVPDHQSDDTMVNFCCTPEAPTKQPNTLFWLFSKVYVIHVAVLLCIIGAVTEFSSYFDDDFLGLLVLKQRISYMVRRYLLQIN